MKRTLLSLAFVIAMFITGATEGHADDGGGMRTDGERDLSGLAR